ncbi:hypothetical protein GA0070622_4609 [Micromonospora sediminicola]|uniref:Acetoacetate decarboxylase n=1 Tax=Micromonospora sediminicola TaxID=946078 RepID=A0A1A9BEN1_9ACTN|nr:MULTISPECIES: hypothetical protein [Micromonospora]PGH45627.1 hypothetical protein COO58_15240 [Micromonospora sp. WMMA1996]SBT67546.1 hypothetical protein GA0070622_4609 [Micromonospora sediminicola]
MLDPAAPQLVINAPTLLFSWIPADPGAAEALVPAGLRAHPQREVFLCQYVVDDGTQTSGFGAYSLTFLGVSLADMDAPDGETPGGWWTHYLASSPRVRQYAAARGAPATDGETHLEVRGGRLTAETRADGRPLIRVTARVGHTGTEAHNGHHRYLTRRDGELIVTDYPYVAEPVSPFEVESVEFLAPEHPVYALRPANPLHVCWGFYSPRVSFAYPARPKVPDEAGDLHQVPARRARSGLPSGS